MKEKEKQSKALYILYIDRLHTSPQRLLRVVEYFLAKELHEWLNTRRKWKFIQKYLKKNIQKCRSQISGSFRDHFARENGVCEISQVHKEVCEISLQQKADSTPLRSWLSSCGVWLPSRRETSGEIPEHCAKWLRNHFAAKG